jgi:hypothetical protein
MPLNRRTCRNCRKAIVYPLIVAPYPHKCKDCDYILCEPCDNKMTTLVWITENDKEIYVCTTCCRKTLERRFEIPMGVVLPPQIKNAYDEK